MTTPLDNAPVLVIGAGIMGAGIAQVASQAGHTVLLFDTRVQAAETARDGIRAQLDKLVAKGKMTADVAAETVGRITPITALSDAADVVLAIEVIVEKLEVKRTLLRQLEEIVAPDCVLASNTSSISITALANGLATPGRLVGMHFFNPVPVMKLVEVISGLHTEPAVAAAIFALAKRWGKTPVHARSTPGFIVNRIARPFYAETLALLLEQAATPAQLDACMRGAGFRMGACELIDLIGHDTNFAVTESVYAANFYDKRYMPSLVQKEMVDGGLLGRKSGRGFFDYRHGGTAVADKEAAHPVSSALPMSGVVLHGSGPVIERWADALTRAGRAVDRNPSSPWMGLSAGSAQLRLTDGRTATQLSAESGERDVAVFDWPVAELPSVAATSTAPASASRGSSASSASASASTGSSASSAATAASSGSSSSASTSASASSAAAAVAGPTLAWSASTTISAAWRAEAEAWLAAAGFTPQWVADAPGLVVARTISMLINEAADAVHNGVCTAEGADAAMKLGVNYPAGPFDWLKAWRAGPVVTLLDHLDAAYHGDRYRVSPMLRQAAWTAQLADHGAAP